MQKEWIWTGTMAAAGMVAACLAALVSGQGLPPGPMPTPTVNVGPVAAVKAANPAPSPAAKNQSQKTTIGVGVASVKASGPSAYWTDLVDIDGDGVEEDTQFLFDKKRGILYTYKQDTYRCADGSSQNGDVLMGIYTQENIAGRPSGSGWYVVAVKAGQCGEKKAGLFGCRFDASGKPTSCGTAKVKEESGEVDVLIKK
jgi:hypothetical protein